MSFAFSRRAERRRPLPAGPCAEPGTGGDADSDTDFLTAVEDRELLRWAREGARPSGLFGAELGAGARVHFRVVHQTLRWAGLGAEHGVGVALRGGGDCVDS